jgi:hypothetical protein
VISRVSVSLIMCAGAAAAPSHSGFTIRPSRNQVGMPTLTRRRSPDRSDCWHVYRGGVHVGTIAARAGVRIDVDQWGWQCGFYPPSHHGRHAVRNCSR